MMAPSIPPTRMQGTAIRRLVATVVLNFPLVPREFTYLRSPNEYAIQLRLREFDMQRRPYSIYRPSRPANGCN
jgi:hypothetical protein